MGGLTSPAATRWFATAVRAAVPTERGRSCRLKRSCRWEGLWSSACKLSLVGKDRQGRSASGNTQPGDLNKNRSLSLQIARWGNLKYAQSKSKSMFLFTAYCTLYFLSRSKMAKVGGLLWSLCWNLEKVQSRLNYGCMPFICGKCHFSSAFPGLCPSGLGK